jgi:hypothetical protein
VGIGRNGEHLIFDQVLPAAIYSYALGFVALD